MPEGLHQRYLAQKLLQNIFFLYLSLNHALLEKERLAVTACHTDISLSGLTGAVYGTAHKSDLQGLFIKPRLRRASLKFRGE